MNKQKWPWLWDQWMEDKVWTKVPEKYSTPHMFFTFGVWAALLAIVLAWLASKLLT